MSRTFEEEMRSLRGASDWATRGRLHEAWRQARPTDDTNAAIAQLARLYPAELVREQVGMPDSALDYVVFPLLIDGWTIRSGELLQLGLDLAVCEGWSGQPHLVARLRNEAEFYSARFEVGLWAGARRVGLEATYITATQAQDCDLEFVDGDDRIRVEAKVCRVSERARGAQRVWDAADRAVRVCTEHLPEVGGIELTIQLEPRMVELVDKGGQEFEARLDALGSALEEHLRACVRPLALDSTTSVIEDVGRVGFRRGREGRGVSISIADIGEDPVQAATRALRPAADARKQLANGGAALRVAAVYTGTLDCPAWHAAAIGARAVRDRPARFAGIDWIVFVNAHTELGDWKTSAAPVAVSPATTAPVAARWLKAMTAWRRSC
ncbi:MAG: hypothetical protein IPH44_30750 [Myxococcales bacterium]|nr:hypothetical protein [Myxococcales bacterium]